MIVNLNNGEGIRKRLLFPDNQPHIQLEDFAERELVDVIVSLVDSKRVLELLMVVDAIRGGFGEPNILYIPYLMGARFDRVMEKNDSFDLRVIAELINSMDFNKVVLFDPHSDVAPALISNSVVLNNDILLKAYQHENPVVIIPDAGAVKKSHKAMQILGSTTAVQCMKQRDVSTGEIKITVLNPELCHQKDCVIVDDICDGGGTFIGIADYLSKEEMYPKSLTLIVSHGIFSNGLVNLNFRFNQIITSNSYKENKGIDSKEFVQTINITPLLKTIN